VRNTKSWQIVAGFILLFGYVSYVGAYLLLDSKALTSFDLHLLPKRVLHSFVDFPISLDWIQIQVSTSRGVLASFSCLHSGPFRLLGFGASWACLSWIDVIRHPSHIKIGKTRRNKAVLHHLFSHSRLGGSGLLLWSLRLANHRVKMSLHFQTLYDGSLSLVSKVSQNNYCLWVVAAVLGVWLVGFNRPEFVKRTSTLAGIALVCGFLQDRLFDDFTQDSLPWRSLIVDKNTPFRLS
jgi:hypothetical protein